MNKHAADGEEAADNDRAEDAFTPIRSDSEKIRQVAVHLIDETVVIPGLPRPEPLPSGTANKSANENHGDPQDDEAKEKCSNCEFALLPRVVPGAERVGINIRNHHEAKDDQCGHDHAGDPGVEVDEHLLEAQEIPRGLRGVDGDDDGGQKFDAQEKGPDVNFFRPAGLERPRLTVMRLRQRCVSSELIDQDVIGTRLLPGEVNVKRQERNHGNDRNVVRGGENFPKLFPIHGYFFASFTSESRTTGAGPEMPPSLRTRQKWRTMKMEAMMGMPMQCQM